MRENHDRIDRVGEGCAADVVESQNKSCPPTGLQGPLGKKGSLNGESMAESSQPATAVQANITSQSTASRHLARSSSTHEDVPGLAGEITTPARDLEILGENASQANESLHSQMAIVTNLRPSQLTRLLNSTPLGTVISERQLYRHRDRAGDKIGNGRKVDLFRYVAWLVETRQSRGQDVRPRNRKQLCDTKIDPGECRLSVSEVIRLLEQQHFRCALSGRKLTPKNAALDHILPVSRGGHHCASNSQALHKDVNRAKGTLTNEEFAMLCQQVASHIRLMASIPSTDRAMR